MIVTVEMLTDDMIENYADEAFRRGDLGGWNLARSAMSDSPLAKRAELFAAIRARLCERINGTAGTKSGADVSAILAVAINARAKESGNG